MRAQQALGPWVTLLAVAWLALASGYASAQTSAQSADRFVDAINRYVATIPQGTPLPPEGVVFRSLTPMLADVRPSRNRLMTAEALRTADRAFTAQAADAPAVSRNPLQRILSDAQLQSIELVAGNLSAMATPQFGDAEMKFCEEDRPYCRAVKSSGWIQESAGVRRMQVELATAGDATARGTALFMDQGGSVFGTLRIGLLTFQIRQLANDVFAITTSADAALDRYKDDVEGLTPGEEQSTPNQPAGGGGTTLVDPAPAADQPQRCANPAATQRVDVLVGVTARATKLAFDQGYDTRHLIRFAETLANVSFDVSDIKGRIRVVDMQPTPYTETGDFGRDIAELLKPKGKLAGLRDARRSVKADVAILIVEHPDPKNCGRAAGIRVEKHNAYAVVNWRCLSDKFSFIHEIGHLAGAWHDPKSVGAGFDVQPPYAYGYVTTGPAPLATIMAYRESCPVPCGRMWFWSNPYKQTEDGQALGTADRNFDACVWRQRLPALAAFDGG